MDRFISIRIKKIVILPFCVFAWMIIFHFLRGRKTVEKTAYLKPKYDVVVVGAGLSGAVMAHLHAKLLNKTVLVVEKRNHIGGNCYDYINDVGIRVSMYGAHLFHTKHERVWKFVQQFSSWTPYEHRYEYTAS